MRLSANVTREVLPNGLTILVQRFDSAPVVAVVTHVKAGYFDEPDEWVGIAHVLEHMFFKGTSRRGPGEIARDTQLLGGYLNAGTIYDKTAYYTVLPSSEGGLEKALDIQSDALKNAALDQDELTRELEVIIQEANRKLDSPDAVAGETLYELLFEKHRMRRWRIGTEEGLRKLTHEDVRTYYSTRYTPGRVVVSVVGDVDTKQVLTLARAAYGDWDRSTVSVEGSPPEPDTIVPSVRVLTGDVKRPLAVLGWKTVGTLHQDTSALDVAASVLGNGRGSRLYRGVRTPGLASSVRAGHYTPTEVGVFDISLAADADRLDEAVTRCVDTVSELLAAVPTATELDRTRALFAMRWARVFESMDSRAAALAEGESLGGYQLIDELHQRALDVTAEEVQHVVSRYLRPEHASLVVYLPEDGHTSLAGDSWPLAPKTQPSPVGPVRDALIESTRGTPAEIVDSAEYPGGISLRSYEGVDMLARSKPGCGLVTLGLDIAGLPVLETPSKAGISRLLVRSTIRGAGGLTGEELALAAESLGGGIVASSSADGLGWGITVPPDALRQAAGLLRKVALEPTLAGAEIAKERTQQISDARRSQDDMFRHPTQRVLGKAYGEDVYGLPVLGEPQTVESLSDNDVREWAAEIGKHRAVLVAVGDLDREQMLSALAPLAGWPAVADLGSGSNGSPEFRDEIGAERRNKAQTALAMAFPAMPAASADRFAVLVLGSLLSGLSGRLFKELREKRSLAYTVAALPWLRRRAGAMLTYIATSPERESEARDVMLRELSLLVEDSIADVELERARNYAAGLVEIRQQHASSVSSEILTAWQNGVLAEIEDTAERLRSVTEEEVNRVARNLFGAGRHAEYVVRGR